MPSRSSFLSLFLASSRVLVDAALPRPVEEYDVLQYIDPLIGSANGGIYGNQTTRLTYPEHEY